MAIDKGKVSIQQLVNVNVSLTEPCFKRLKKKCENITHVYSLNFDKAREALQRKRLSLKLN